MHEGYKDAVCYRITVNGFKACCVWNNAKGTADARIITSSDITNICQHESREETHNPFMELVQDYLCNVRLLISDCDVNQNSSLYTTTGAILTSAEVLTVLQKGDEDRDAAAELRETRAADAARRREARELQDEFRKLLRLQEEERLAVHS